MFQFLASVAAGYAQKRGHATRSWVTCRRHGYAQSAATLRALGVGATFLGAAIRIRSSFLPFVLADQFDRSSPSPVDQLEHIGTRYVLVKIDDFWCGAAYFIHRSTAGIVYHGPFNFGQGSLK